MALESLSPNSEVPGCSISDSNVLEYDDLIGLVFGLTGP
jgi:hypothetical protein